MNCTISQIEYYLPANIVTNQDLLMENPQWDIEALVSKTGVKQRHIASDQETSFDLGAKACEKLFDKGAVSPSDIDAIMFCTQSPDYIMPGNSFLLHRKFGFLENVLTFDINLACSGYVYGLAMAKAFFNTYPLKNLLLVTADTYSRYIHPKDKSVRLLFGDGAAATVLKPSARNGIIDAKFATYGLGYEHFMIPAGGARVPKSSRTRKASTDKNGNVRTPEHIAMEGFALVSLARGKVLAQVREVLKANALSVEDIDLFIFHQASQLVLDSFQKSLEIPDKKLFNNLSLVGNTVSSSLPIAIKDAMDQGRIRKGSKLILCGFGVGFSWATALVVWE